MLTKVLLRYFLRFTLGFVGVATALAYFVLGEAAALGALAGGGLMLVTGFGLVYGVGRLLDPTVKTATKTGLMMVLLIKLMVVAVLLWLMLSVFGLDGLGILIGMGAGLAGLVIGLNFGSASPEGVRAMEQAEARIAQEMGDRDDHSR